MMEIVFCDRCGDFIEKPKHKVKKLNYCNRECAKGPRHQITKPCEECGKPVTRVRSQMRQYVLCSLECSRAWSSRWLTGINIELNPDRMIPETRRKLRIARLDSGEGKTYTKIYSRHAHRVVAEQMLGRPLLPGEVVHHIDNNRRNNNPSNLIVFASQADHARHHQDLLRAKKK
jgi:endogenous inhibitor of DNA gyrase (YacG/DUF329 family)